MFSSSCLWSSEFMNSVDAIQQITLRCEQWSVLNFSEGTYIQTLIAIRIAYMASPCTSPALVSCFLSPFPYRNLHSLCLLLALLRKWKRERKILFAILLWLFSQMLMFINVSQSMLVLLRLFVLSVNSTFFFSFFLLFLNKGYPQFSLK